jgi:hypothetical protein
MSVYVRMDVHRMRSQVAIVVAAGVPSATATWPTTYRTPVEVATTWRPDPDMLQTQAT